MLYAKNTFKYFLDCNGLSNNDVEVARGTVFRNIRPGAVSKTGDFVRETLEWLPQNDAFSFSLNYIHIEVFGFVKNTLTLRRSLKKELRLDGTTGLARVYTDWNMLLLVTLIRRVT